MADEERRIRICPICGSDDVEADFTDPAMAAAGGSNQWHCNHCDHIGKVFLEVPLSEVPEEPTPRDQLPDRQQVDTSYGRGLVGAWKIIAPVGIMGSLFLLLSSFEWWARLMGLYGVFLNTVFTAYAYRTEAFQENPWLRRLKNLAAYSFLFLLISLLLSPLLYTLFVAVLGG